MTLKDFIIIPNAEINICVQRIEDVEFEELEPDSDCSSYQVAELVSSRIKNNSKR